MRIPLSAFEHPAGARRRILANMHVVPDPSARSILLLDDDPDVGIAAQLLLQRRVGPVHCIRRPGELIAAIERVHPSLLLLDLNFGPGRTDGSQGLRLLDEVHARPGAPVVVVLTAYADIDLAVRALKRGAFDFIVKPWDNVRLVATCQEALQHAPEAVEESAVSTTASPQTLAAQERAAVMAALAEAQGNLSAAARTLGLSRAALYRRLEKHGL
jgi:DNA-binding NtrC family response regulator